MSEATTINSQIVLNSMNTVAYFILRMTVSSHSDLVNDELREWVERFDKYAASEPEIAAALRSLIKTEIEEGSYLEDADPSVFILNLQSELGYPEDSVPPPSSFVGLVQSVVYEVVGKPVPDAEGFQVVSDENITYTNGNVRVSFEYIGEGYGGDYNEGDPDDRPLFRMDVAALTDGEWKHQQSYCTSFPVDASIDEKKRALKLITERVKPAIDADDGIKAVCEELSWIDPSWVTQPAS